MTQWEWPNKNDPIKLSKCLSEIAIRANVQNGLSFADITFEKFNGYTIKIMHHNTFGRAAENITQIVVEQ